MKIFSRHVYALCLTLLFFSSGIALSSPVRKDIVLMIDNSGSMKKNAPNSLIKTAAKEFVENLAEDDQIAILIFDHDIKLVLPLMPVTEETRDEILSSLKKIDFKGRHTRIPSAMERAIYELKTKGREGSQKSIIFITDGIVDTGDRTLDAERKKWLLESLVQDAARAGIKIFGIALTDQADFELIQSLAQKTSGDYFRIFNTEDISRVFSKIDNLISETGIDRGSPVIRKEPEPPIEEASRAKPEKAVDFPKAPLTPLSATISTIGAEKEEKVESVPARPEKMKTEARQDQEESRVNYWMVILLAVLIIIAIAVFKFVRRKDPLERTEPKLIYETEKEDEEPVILASLKDTSGVTGQIAFELKDDVTIIGRDAANEVEDVNNIIIPKSTISRQHAAIQRKNNSFWLKDLGSTNGTLLNNREVSGEMTLKHGDVIMFDVYEFKFIMPKDAGKDETGENRTTIRNPEDTMDEEVGG